jgi:hypothetical protein
VRSSREPGLGKGEKNQGCFPLTFRASWNHHARSKGTMNRNGQHAQFRSKRSLLRPGGGLKTWRKVTLGESMQGHKSCSPGSSASQPA